MSYFRADSFYKNPENDYPIVNILNLENPDLVNCSFSEVEISQSRIVLTCVSQASTEKYRGYKLHFVFTDYFELSPVWKGLTLNVAPPGRCLELLQRNTSMEAPLNMMQEIVKSGAFTVYELQGIKHRFTIMAQILYVYPLPHVDQDA